MVREVIRTGEDSREEATELEMDAGAEAVGGFGTSLGTWDMAGFEDLTVGCDSSGTPASLARGSVGFEAASTSVAVLEWPSVPFREGGLSDSAAMVPVESDYTDTMQTSQETREEARQLGRSEAPRRGSHTSEVEDRDGKAVDGVSMSCPGIVMLCRRQIAAQMGMGGANNRRPHADQRTRVCSSIASGASTAGSCRWVGRWRE